jgi:hypothetical protein
VEVDQFNGVLLGTKVGVLVTDMGCNSADFDVQALELLMSMKYLKVGVESKAASRSGPLTVSNVLPSVTEEIEVRQECILDDIFPSESSTRGSKRFGGGVILIES